jgi:SprT protein
MLDGGGRCKRCSRRYGVTVMPEPVPCDALQRARVIAATGDWIARAGRLYGRPFPEIPVHFDLEGLAAGMYQVRGRQRVIRYNPYLFARYPRDSLEVTVPHEVAHYITDMLFDRRRVRPHGAQWRGVMQAMGVDTLVTANYDLAGIPVRRQRRYVYHCVCRDHRLSACRHNRIHRGAMRYSCRSCNSELIYDSADATNSSR